MNLRDTLQKMFFKSKELVNMVLKRDKHDVVDNTLDADPIKKGIISIDRDDFASLNINAGKAREIINGNHLTKFSTGKCLTEDDVVSFVNDNCISAGKLSSSELVIEIDRIYELAGHHIYSDKSESQKKEIFVPPYVDEFIKEYKESDFTISEVFYTVKAIAGIEDERVQNWILENEEDFALAWITDSYTIKSDTKYEVFDILDDSEDVICLFKREWMDETTATKMSLDEYTSLSAKERYFTKDEVSEEHMYLFEAFAKEVNADHYEQ